MLDFDKDSLPDLIEVIYNTDPATSDTDKDGISDGAEVAQGTDPLGGFIAQTGIIGSADTPGNAVDICVQNNLAVVADAEAGVAVFNVFDNANPRLIAQVDTPGNAQRVACANGFVAVADHTGGVAILDMRNAADIKLAQQINLNDEVTAVVSDGDTVYVGTKSGGLNMIDLNTGLIYNQTVLSGGIDDLAIKKHWLYALSRQTKKLYTFDLSNGQLNLVNSTDVPGAAGEPSWRLFVGESILYALHTNGYDTFTIAQPAQPSLIKAGTSQQFGWKQIVENGSGLGVVIVGPNAPENDPHDLALYDVSNPNETDVFVTQFQTLGAAHAVALNAGRAYVADGIAGMQVINFLAYDSQKQPPTVTLVTSPTGPQIEEGSRIQIGVDAKDDVQVRAVELLVDGAVVATDGNYPYEFTIMAPRLSTQASFVIAARATDTGGNQTITPGKQFTLVADKTAPSIFTTTPQQGWLGVGVATITAIINEPINPTLLATTGIRLLNLGANGVLGGGDDTTVPPNQISLSGDRMLIIALNNQLPRGNYQLTIDPIIIADSLGNQMAAPYVLNFSAIEAQAAGTNVWIGPSSGDWYSPQYWSNQHIPRADERVVIDRFPEVITVTHSSGETTVTSLNSNGNLVMTGGRLILKENSTVKGNLSVKQAVLQTNGTKAIFKVNGAVTLERAQLEALDGGQIQLPTAQQYNASAGGIASAVQLYASGTGSLINLSNVTNLQGDQSWGGNFYVKVLNGGQIDLRNTATITNGNMLVTADGAGSSVNLSAMTVFSSTPGFQSGNSLMEVINGGTIVVPALRVLGHTDLRLNPSSTLATAQINRIFFGQVTITGMTANFQNLNDADFSNFAFTAGGTANFPSLTKLNRVGFDVQDGAQLNLPNVTHYNASTYGINSAVALKATGNGSTINLSNVTTLFGDPGWAGRLLVQAVNGGHIDLGSTTVVTTGVIMVTADGTGSNVNLSALTTLNAVPGFQSSDALLEVKNGGTILAPNLANLEHTELRLHPGSQFNCQTITFAADAQLRGDGTLACNVIANGQVAPGLSPGILTLNNGYQQTNLGKFAVEMGGTAAGTAHDRLTIVGSATLAGKLTIALVNNYQPNIGDTFTIVQAGSISGAFETVDGLTIGNGKQFQVQYGAQTVTLQVIAQ